MTGFDAAWLQQREPFDLAARDPGLAAAFAAALPRRPDAPVRLIDLAAGTGANCRALAPVIGGDQDWLLIDHDPLLLAAQHRHIAAWAARQGWRSQTLDRGLAVHAGAARWHVRGQALDLAQSLEALDLTHFDGIVTTAFLDLVSAAWLDRLGASITRARRPLLATLSVDGRREWHPPLPGDADRQAAFLRHQAGDKGFGVSLGPRAVAHLAQGLSAHGLSVHTARSDWRIGPEHPAMLQRLVDEAASVARQAAPEAAGQTVRWRAERCRQIDAGELRLIVGHVDLLALPQVVGPQPGPRKVRGGEFMTGKAEDVPG